MHVKERSYHTGQWTLSRFSSDEMR